MNCATCGRSDQTIACDCAQRSVPIRGRRWLLRRASARKAEVGERARRKEARGEYCLSASSDGEEEDAEVEAEVEEDGMDAASTEVVGQSETASTVSRALSSAVSERVEQVKTGKRGERAAVRAAFVRELFLSSLAL